MKKVLFLVNHEIVIYNFRRELVEKLLELDYEVFISSPKGKKIDELVAMGAKFIETKIDRRGINPLKDIRLYREYKRIIKDISPVFILTYTIKPNIYGGLAAKRTKTHYLVNITGLGSGIQRKGLLARLLVIMYKKALKKADSVFVQNEQNRKFVIENKIFSDPTLLLGSGVNISKFIPMPYLVSEELNIIFIARVMKEKGIDEFLEAAKYFRKKGYKHKFHICGFMEDDYKEIIDSLVKENVVIYHGLVNDMTKIYALAHVIVNPSYHEGMSNVLLEGAATARPLLASNIPGCQEIIDDGKNGFLFNVKSSNDLILKLEYFVNLSHETRMEIGLKSREKVEKEFNRNIIINKYLDEINKI